MAVDVKKEMNLAIRNGLCDVDIWTQLAEECAELAQAALKMARYNRKRNSPAKDLPELLQNVYEEVADVSLCLDVLSLSPRRREVATIKDTKRQRWYNRLWPGREIEVSDDE